MTEFIETESVNVETVTSDLLQALILSNHCGSLVAATIALTRQMTDLDRLLYFRAEIGEYLSDPMRVNSVINEIDEEYSLRHAMLAAATVIDARIAELTEPTITNIVTFATITVQHGKERDIARGCEVLVPNLSATVGKIIQGFSPATNQQCNH